MPLPFTDLIDPLYRVPLKLPRVFKDLTHEDNLTREHAVHHTTDESLPGLMMKFNRATRDAHLARPGRGRWVEYILPNLHRVYAEANLQKLFTGQMPDEVLTARVVIKPFASKYTMDLRQMVLMGFAEVTGDLMDVVRTAQLVGLSIQEPATRGSELNTQGVSPMLLRTEKTASVLSYIEKEAGIVDFLAKSPGDAARSVATAAKNKLKGGGDVARKLVPSAFAAGRGVQRGAQAVGSSAARAAQAVKDTAKTTAGAVKSTAQKGSNMARRAAEATSDKVKATAKATAGAVKSTAEAGKNLASRGAQAARSGAAAVKAAPAQARRGMFGAVARGASRLSAGAAKLAR